mgnify:FL=1
MEKYGEQFKYPEKFARLAGEIIAVKQPATNEHREKPMMHHPARICRKKGANYVNGSK